MSNTRNKKSNYPVSKIKLEIEADVSSTSFERDQQPALEKICDRTIKFVADIKEEPTCASNCDSSANDVAVIKQKLPLSNKRRVQLTKAQVKSEKLDESRSQVPLKNENNLSNVPNYSAVSRGLVVLNSASPTTHNAQGPLKVKRVLATGCPNRLNSSILTIPTFGGNELDRRQIRDDDNVAANSLSSQATLTNRLPYYCRVLQTSSRNSDALPSRGRILERMNYSKTTVNIDENSKILYRTAQNQSSSAPAKRVQFLEVQTPRFSQISNAQIAHEATPTNRPRPQLRSSQQMSTVSNIQILPTAGRISHSTDSQLATNATLAAFDSAPQTSSAANCIVASRRNKRKEDLKSIQDNDDLHSLFLSTFEESTWSSRIKRVVDLKLIVEKSDTNCLHFGLNLEETDEKNFELLMKLARKALENGINEDTRQKLAQLRTQYKVMIEEDNITFPAPLCELQVTSRPAPCDTYFLKEFIYLDEGEQCQAAYFRLQKVHIMYAYTKYFNRHQKRRERASLTREQIVARRVHARDKKRRIAHSLKILAAKAIERGVSVETLRKLAEIRAKYMADTIATTSRASTKSERLRKKEERTKRQRTVYNRDQIHAFETLFAKDKYPSRELRDRLAKRWNVPEFKVYSWFIQRRVVERRKARGLFNVSKLTDENLKKIFAEFDDAAAAASVLESGSANEMTARKAYWDALEKIFQIENYPTFHQLEEIVTKFGRTNEAIKTWLKKRRLKERVENPDATCLTYANVNNRKRISIDSVAQQPLENSNEEVGEKLLEYKSDVDERVDEFLDELFAQYSSSVDEGTDELKLKGHRLFTLNQSDLIEKFFEKFQYPHRSQIMRIAETFDVKYESLCIWFKNRRIRERKTNPNALYCRNFVAQQKMRQHKRGAVNYDGMDFSAEPNFQKTIRMSTDELVDLLLDDYTWDESESGARHYLFSERQWKIAERIFQKDKFPKVEHFEKISKAFRIHCDLIRIWYVNRRKRDVNKSLKQQMRSASLASANTSKSLTPADASVEAEEQCILPYTLVLVNVLESTKREWAVVCGRRVVGEIVQLPAASAGDVASADHSNKSDEQVSERAKLHSPADRNANTSLQLNCGGRDDDGVNLLCKVGVVERAISLGDFLAKSDVLRELQRDVARRNESLQNVVDNQLKKNNS